MNNTFTTWGGKPLPEGYKIEIYSCTCIRLLHMSDPCGSWFFTGKKWKFGYTPILELTNCEVDIISNFPNAAPEFIAWCREQGIEVPGGEIKRVEIDLTAVLQNDQVCELSIPEQFVEALRRCNIKPGVTATLTLEMRP